VKERFEYSNRQRSRFHLILAAMILLIVSVGANAQTVPVGAGSYTTVAPPGVPTPQTNIFRTGGGPVNSHKFWTSKYWDPLGFNPGPINMFPEPLSLQVLANGLAAGYHPTVHNNGTWFNKPFQHDLTIGTAGLNASAVNISDSSDWAVDFNFGPITTRVGRGMPFVYVLTNGSNPTVTFTGQPTVFANNGNILGVSIAGNSYGLFGPPGSTWSGIGSATLTCNLAGGARYFSLAILPNQAALSTFASRAFSFPIDTQVSWNYDQTSSQVTTTYTVTTQPMDGVSSGFLMALYPHQYASLPGGANTTFTYASPRGTMRVFSGASFTTVDTFNGTLPYLPRTSNYNATTIQNLLTSVVNEPNHFTAGDTYFLGKQLNRIAQLLPIAQQTNPTQFNTLLNRLKSQLQSWFNANGKTTNLFYYNQNWGTLIGYPGSFGSEAGLNDHHFHYGYWIHAAAIVGIYDRNWIAQNNWGGMVDLLLRDIASTNRNDPLFPFMRNFDVYAGHSWASGEAPFGDGGNEESSSEAINAWAGMILYGALTNNTQIRDAGIWLYTMETNAAFYYWFNAMPTKTFPAGFTRTQIANLFDAKSDAATWFGANPEFVHGIEFLPFTGASLYLGRDPAYCQTNFNEVLTLNGGSLVDWPDLMQMYEAFFNPADAVNRWNSTSFTEGGETRAHQYAWLQTLSALGRVHTAVTANWPYYAVFRNPSNGTVTHVAFNPTAGAVTVGFSDGASLNVPAGALAMDGSTPGDTTPPSTPTNLTSPSKTSTSVTLSWGASTDAQSGVAGYEILRNGAFDSFVTTTTATVSNLTANTTYTFAVRARNGAGLLSALSNTISVTTNPAAGGLPSPWQNADIGSVTPAGSASFASGTFTVRGAGADIWGTADGFHFVYQTLNGNGEVVARVATIQNTDPWAKVGVMIRESLTAGSRHALMCLTPGNGLAFQRRNAPNGQSVTTAGGAGTAPVWVRLVRNGSTITAFRSANGTTWTQVGTDTVAMGTQVFVGMAVTSHLNGTLNTSTFTNVTVTPTGGGGGGAISINAGGSAAGSFVADTGFSGGSVATTTVAINTSLVSAPVPPQAVYQSERWGACTYTIGGFAPGSAHTVSLHFAEFFWTTAGQRQFNVIINGAQVLTNFDIIAVAGGPNRASQQNFSVTANSSGQIVIQFTVGAVDQPKISGIVVQ
jgi:endoglucanase Acf2